MLSRHRVVFVTRFPVVTTVFLVGALAGFLLELVQGRGLSEFLLRYGIVPSGLEAYFRDAGGTTLGRNLLPFFSSVFLHGGYIHLLSNVLFLWLVGDVVESWLGRTRFLLLFLFGVIAELIVRVGLTDPIPQVASVGISGAVAACIGGYVVILTRVGRGEGTTSEKVPVRATMPLMVGGLLWFPLQMLNPMFAVAVTCQTDAQGAVCWLGLLMSFALGVFLVSMSGPRKVPPTPDPLALPHEQAAVISA